jgi:hypothetical protein
MFDWIKSIPMELDMMEESEILQITGEIGKGEKVIGEVPIPLRKMYSLLMTKIKKSRLLDIERSFATSQEKMDGMAAEGLKLALETRTLAPLFWIEIHSIYGMWDVSLGLRKGYKIVTLPDQPNIPQFFLGET